MHLYIVPAWYPQNEGDITASFFREQAQALAERSHRVTVIHIEPVSVAYKLVGWKPLAVTAIVLYVVGVIGSSYTPLGMEIPEFVRSLWVGPFCSGAAHFYDGDPVFDFGRLGRAQR